MIRNRPKLSDPVTGALLDPDTGALIGYEYQLRSTLPVWRGSPMNYSLEIAGIDPVSGQRQIVTVSLDDKDEDDA